MHRTILWVVVGVVAAVQVSAAAPAKSERRVDVQFAKPASQFVDVRDRYPGTEKGQAEILRALKQHLEKRAAAVIPAGHTLRVTLTEVDLAGEFRPGRRDDIRVILESYPPAIDLEFVLKSPDGKVVSEGKRELRDPFFMRSVSRMNDRPLRYETKLLDDWLRSEFKGGAKAGR